MVRKIAAILSAGAMTLAMAVPALAYWQMPTINLDSAIVKTETMSIADTGSNTQGNMASLTKGHADDIYVHGDNDMWTGTAVATATSKVGVNNQMGCSTCGWSWKAPDSIKNIAYVTSSTMSQATTGGNTQINSIDVKKAGVDDITVCGDNDLKTGNATATSTSWTTVNAQWSGFSY